MKFGLRTILGEVVWAGRGLHSGSPVEVVARAGHDGIAFTLGDQRILATPENVTDTTRCTRLGPISTIEHLMSALAGLGITDLEVQVSGPEMPALDGAAAEYVRCLRPVIAEPFGEAEVDGPFARVFEKGDAHEIAIGAGDGFWQYDFVTGDRWPGHQSVAFALDAATYADQVAPARTFAFEEELEMVRKAGLGQGLDETTALVLGASDYVNAARFADEPARHKLLDLIGDLALAGVPVRALNVHALRSGHTANVAAAGRLAAHAKVIRL